MNPDARGIHLFNQSHENLSSPNEAGDDLKTSEGIADVDRLRPVAITQPVGEMLTTMCPSCRQLMQLPKNASVIMCPKCTCKSQIRIKYTTYFKCPKCTATLRCGATERRIKCPKCYETLNMIAWRARHNKLQGKNSVQGKKISTERQFLDQRNTISRDHLLKHLSHIGKVER